MKTKPLPIWRHIQRRNFTDWNRLIAFLELTSSERVLPHPTFPLNLPFRLASKIRKNCWEDPILLQFLPQQAELDRSPLFSLDPVEDHLFKKTPKLLHKYQGRALLLASSACAMHCRYCFRKNFEYDNTTKQFQLELETIRKDPSLSEILLSGGDPLSLSNAQLERLFQELDSISHVKRIRFHTRFPIGIPERIDTDFLQVLKNCSKQVIFVIHCNHAQELDKEIFAHLRQIQYLGIPVLSQSVLLKGINDSIDALISLFLELIDQGILPYYLHQLDRVQGSSHFEVSEEKGQELMRELQEKLPGYAVPRYVKEEAHRPHKTAIIPNTESGITSCPES